MIDQQLLDTVAIEVAREGKNYERLLQAFGEIGMADDGMLDLARQRVRDNGPGTDKWSAPLLSMKDMKAIRSRVNIDRNDDWDGGGSEN
ncbi:hypothetical protein SAMN04490244_10393 [Tranquillimonas rosea]|uniref:Uncharacterized protein n=1 Tax=Tranquillimonas rosea TaxID=641238 RepID=A0A1H9S989_9RHOB|nr:hypothetical protein [Tranquillimonas rosea]SER81606.1 hypothetical protein SAMN04490244_10393 [Tranquillimonas rosea]